MAINDAVVIILAAGLSSRMGESKLSLAWGNNTVIGSICDAFHSAGVISQIVVIGGYGIEVEQALVRLSFEKQILRTTNPHPESSGMLDSLKIGLECLPKNCDQVFIALGDQPQVTPTLIANLYDRSDQRSIVIPSFNNRRGHPWLISRCFVDSILDTPEGNTMREWINSHTEYIRYIEAGPDILMDLDTPEDYIRQKP